MNACLALMAVLATAGQQRPIEPDLAALVSGSALRVVNRQASVLSDSGRRGLRLNESPGDGVAYLTGIELGDGTIELDLRGKDVPQQSFVGVAFHGVGDSSEVVYFRPFNFRTPDPARRVRAVQYVSHPTHTWDKLRAEHPGVYEKAVEPVPDPNGWFHARIVVSGATVRVYVNDATEPCLVVTRLTERGKGLVGLWVGNNSAGEFARLKIRPQ